MTQSGDAQEPTRAIDVSQLTWRANEAGLVTNRKYEDLRRLL